MTKRFSFSFFALSLFMIITPILAQAQTIGIGADIFSRYIWRGYDFGDSFSAQPYLALNVGNLKLVLGQLILSVLTGHLQMNMISMRVMDLTSAIPPVWTSP